MPEPIDGRLRQYFTAKGAQPSEAQTTDRLTFTSDKETVQVIIIRDEAFTERGKIVDALLDAATLREGGDRVYVAASALFGTAMDADSFQKHGIGLMIFDEKRISEVVYPRLAQPRGYPERSTTAIIEPRAAPSAADFAELKSMYMEMLTEFSSLKERVEQSSVEAPTKPSRAVQRISPGPAQQPAGELPSFFAENPWLEVLSKRGKEEGPIAS